MAAKMSLLVGAVVAAGSLGVASLATLGNFTSYNQGNFPDNSKISDQEKWRKEFYREKLYDETLMCPSSDIGECSKGANKDKEYLPAPGEDWLWRKAYESLESNRKQDSEKKQTSHNGSSKNEQLPDVKNSEDLRDYCYQEVQEAIKNGNSGYFNVSQYVPKDTQNKKYHDRCVLTLGS